MISITITGKFNTKNEVFMGKKREKHKSPLQSSFNKQLIENQTILKRLSI